MDGFDFYFTRLENPGGSYNFAKTKTASIMSNPTLVSPVEPQVQMCLAHFTARPDGEETACRTPLETLFNTLQLLFLSNTSIV
jgi:hypothetical protein